MAIINKKELGHLAKLARLELPKNQETKFLKDLGEILDYFKELETLDTTNIEPLTGGTDLKNIVREDEAGKTDDTGKGKESFPDSQKGYLKVPPVF